MANHFNGTYVHDYYESCCVRRNGTGVYYVIEAQEKHKRLHRYRRQCNLKVI
jgi:hypothetical protein